MTILINTCLVNGVLPECLKLTRTIPILKIGDPSSISNFIVLNLHLAYALLVLESIINNQLLDFVESNNLLAGWQHGSRRGKSTVTALMSIVEQVNYTLEEGSDAV